MADDKQVKLQQVMEDLSKERRILKPEVQEKYINAFKDIYSEIFRHLYSGIFGLLTTLDSGERTCLEQNLSYIYRLVKEDYANEVPDCTLQGLRKLYDHVALDGARINYWEGTQDRYGSELKKTRRVQSELAEGIDKQKKKTSKLVKRLEKAKNDYITILGIFAAIILGAVGSLTYSGKILEEAGNTNNDLSRLIIVAMVLGVVLTSITNLFLSFILKVNGKEFNGWSLWECITLILLTGCVALLLARLLQL